MRVAMVTGSYPPEVCGVGDYTYRLVCVLNKIGINVDVISGRNWGIGTIKDIVKNIESLKPDIIHIQYPTVGFGASLTPQLLSFLSSGVITLHEVSQAHILRKLALYPFTIKTKHFIFTNEYERKYALKWAPSWVQQRTSVIPIGSNISIGQPQQKREIDEIIYFGLIRPNKGIEEVLELAEKIKASSKDYRIRIIGLPDPRKLTYFESLQARSIELPIIWDIGLSEQQVAQILANAKVGYVPFPDGASERRGSLLALLSNGVATVTTKGLHTPDTIDGAVEFAGTPEEALACVNHLFFNQKYRDQLSKKAQACAAMYSWESIGIQHSLLYENLIKSGDKK